jgi:predicted HNH restriction endonuclease
MAKYITLTDPDICVFCGIQNDPMAEGCRRLVEVHHIKEKHLGGNNEKGNLVPCCSNHHSLIHQNKIIPLRWYNSTAGWVLQYKNEVGLEKFTLGHKQLP